MLWEAFQVAISARLNQRTMVAHLTTALFQESNPVP